MLFSEYYIELRTHHLSIYLYFYKFMSFAETTFHYHIKLLQIQLNLLAYYFFKFLWLSTFLLEESEL